MLRVESARARGKVHVVDLVALVLAIGLAALAYAYLFRRTPVPRPVDPLLGAAIDVEFRPDKPWKQSFPVTGKSAYLDEYLEADVTGAEDTGGVRVVHLRVKGRDTQKPEALTLFRTGVRRGTSLRLSSEGSEVVVEVVDVKTVAENR
jgi:hypothetical protein